MNFQWTPDVKELKTLNADLSERLGIRFHKMKSSLDELFNSRSSKLDFYLRVKVKATIDGR